MSSDLSIEAIVRPRRSARAAEAAEEAQGAPPISVAQMLVYAVPLSAAAFLLFFVQFYFLKFATDVLLLAPATVGALFALAKVWDAVANPLVGYWSDRTTHRAGRRRPWMWASLPLFGASFVLLWTPPEDLAAGPELLRTGVLLLVLYSASTLFLVPHASLGAELTTDAHQRNRIFGLRHATWTAGLLASFAAIRLVTGSGDVREAVREVAIWGAACGVGLLAITPAFTRESGAGRGRGGVSLSRALADVRANRHARLLLAVWFIESLGAGVVGVLSPYVAEYVLRRPDLVATLPGIYVVAGVLAVPVWVRLARLRGRRRTWLVAMVGTAFAFGGTFFAASGDTTLLFVLIGVAGACMGCGGALGNAILTDVIDDDERRTGERKEGVYSAAWAFALKLAVGAVTLAVGVVLEIAGFVPNQPQSASVTWALRGLFAGVPCAAFLLGAYLFRRFDLEPGRPAGERVA